MWYKNKVLASLFILTLVFTLSFGMAFNDYLVLADEVTEEDLQENETESTTESVIDLSEGEEPIDGTEGEEPTDGTEGEEPADGTEGEETTDGTEGEEPADGTEGEEPADGTEGEEPADGTEGEEPTDGTEGEAPTDGTEGEEPADGTEGEEPADGIEGEEPADGTEGEAPTDGTEGETPVDGTEGETPADVVEEETLLTVEPSLTLSMITVNEEPLDGFDSGTYQYVIELPESTTSLPKVIGIPVEEGMKLSYHIDQANTLIKIQVGPNEKCAIYELNFIGLEETVEPPIGVWGMWLPPTEDEFVLEKRSTKIRFWVQTPLLYPSLKIFEMEDDALGSEVISISTSDLMINTGGGKHSRMDSSANIEEGYYQFNLKGKNCTSLQQDQRYAIAVYDGDELVEFSKDEPAILEFTLGYDSNNSVVKERNKDFNQSSRRSNVSRNR